jgi:hypothetical protein
MNRDAIDEVGAFSWARIQRLYDADAVVHRQSSSLPTVVPDMPPQAALRAGMPIQGDF